MVFTAKLVAMVQIKAKANPRVYADLRASKLPGQSILILLKKYIYIYCTVCLYWFSYIVQQIQELHRMLI